MVPLCSEEFICCCPGRDSCMLPSGCTLPSLRSAPSCHRFGQVQASPALCPSQPRHPRGEVQAVSCDARSETRLLATSSSLPRSAQVRSPDIQYQNTCYFTLEVVLTFPGYVQVSRKKRSTGSPRRFRSFMAELGPARCEIAGFTTCAPRRTYP